jgi:non-ribosomal peptide synthetase component F
MARAYELSATDRALQFATPHFDVAIEEIFPALASGATLVLRDEPNAPSASEFWGFVVREKLNVLNIPTAYWHEIVREADETDRPIPACVRLVIVGGEAPRADLLARWLARVRGASRWINAYGITEATITSTFFVATQLPDARGTVPIGRPIAGTRAYVLDRTLEHAPIGVTGELFLGGAGVARGYVGQPSLTSERFVSDPNVPGARMYRTGDRARVRADGMIEFIGRADAQIKLRGYRIEPGEIEQTLAQHRAVDDVAVTVVRDDDGADGVLSAYWVPTSGEPTATTDELRTWLAARLPTYMIPTAWTRLERLPRSSTGKIDRRALPRPQIESTVAPAESLPMNPVESALAAIWRTVLRREHVSGSDDFFHVGGNSLLAMQVVTRIRSALDVEVPVRTIFEARTLERLARDVSSLRREAAGVRLPPVRHAHRDEPLALSFAQERLWFLQQLEPVSSAYNSPAVVDLEGALDVSAVEQSFREIVRRHEVLRTVFETRDGKPRQRIVSEASFALRVDDLRPLADREGTARRLIEEDIATPFDLERGPVIRARLLRLADDHARLSVVLHHVAIDDASFGVLVREFAVLYESFAAGRASPLAPLAIQYADYAAWQRSWLQGETLESEIRYWTAQLDGAPSLLALPTDRPRPPVASFRGARCERRIPRALSAELETTANALGVTPFMILYAAFAAVLARHSGQRDVLVGTPIANRSAVETESLIGFFANVLVLRADLRDDPVVRDFIQRAREMLLGAYAHQDLPFEVLVDAVRPARDRSVSPLVQTLFVLLNARQEVLELPGLRVLPPPPIEAVRAKYDLQLYIGAFEQDLSAALVFNADLFDQGSAERILAHFEHTLAAMLREPDTRVLSLDPRTADERAADQQRAQTRVEGNRRKLLATRAPRVPLAASDLVTVAPLRAEGELPTVIRPTRPDVDLAGWAKAQRAWIEEKLAATGALLFRGFPVRSLADFEAFALALAPELLDYTYGSTPRSRLAGKVYSSTEYPADQTIPLHNELSYSREWPLKLWFYCAQEAQEGGATPIADSARVYERIDPAVRAKFERLGVMYVRNYHSGADVDLSWPTAFQSRDRAEVEAFCRRVGMAFEWLDGGRLRTSQVCPAVMRHPRSGALVWFNQAHLFHVSSLGESARSALLSVRSEADLPRNAYYGDGSPIEPEALAAIRAAYARAEVSFPWERFDVMLLDNVMAAHGRAPFRGPRKIAVAMADIVVTPARAER